MFVRLSSYSGHIFPGYKDSHLHARRGHQRGKVCRELCWNFLLVDESLWSRQVIGQVLVRAKSGWLRHSHAGFLVLRCVITPLPSLGVIKLPFAPSFFFLSWYWDICSSLSPTMSRWKFLRNFLMAFCCPMLIIIQRFLRSYTMTATSTTNQLIKGWQRELDV